MKTTLSALALMLLTSATEAAQPPDFIQAGAFFWDGVPNVSTKVMKNGKAGVEMVEMGHSPEKLLYFTSDEDPCTLIRLDLEQNGVAKAQHINFTKLPGPYSITWNYAGWMMTNLIDGAVCESNIRKDDFIFRHGLS